jgi:hypothetical protein
VRRSEPEKNRSGFPFLCTTDNSNRSQANHRFQLGRKAFCEAALLHFDECRKPLAQVFDEDRLEVDAALHAAFVSYHVGIRQDALKTMAELVDKRRDLPTVCLLLGNMLGSAGQMEMAKKCWSLAVQRDRPGGAVAQISAHYLRKSNLVK